MHSRSGLAQSRSSCRSVAHAPTRAVSRLRARRLVSTRSGWREASVSARVPTRHAWARALPICFALSFSGTVCAQTDWPTFGHDLAGTRYSTLKQIDTKNVTKLQRAWTYHMSVAAAPAPAAGSSEAGDAVEGGGRGRGGRGGRGGGGRGGNSEVS